MDRKMIRCALLGAMALLSAACLKKGDFKDEFNSHLLVSFEPEYDYMWDDFVDAMFDHGRDTVAASPSLSVGPIYHFAKVDAEEGFFGGFVLARGRNADASVDQAPSRFAVFDEHVGYNNSKAYAVFHDTTATLMPEHAVRIVIPNEFSSCTTEFLYVHNVQAAVQAAVHGVGLADGPFLSDDYLTLTVTGILDGKETGSKEVKLIDGTSYIKEWTKVDLASLGSIDGLDLHISSSRPDFPLYCCLDDMGYYYHELYQ